MPTELLLEMPLPPITSSSSSAVANGRLPPVRKISQTSVERIMMRSARKLSKGAAPVGPIAVVEGPRPRFGFMFDIDGVFFKGKYVIEEAKEAVRLLTDENGEWRVPCVWVTNAANPPPMEKAAIMSQGLGVKIHPDQVLMAHSPLNMFRQYHDKFSLVIGQGPICDIARALGFKKITTMDAVTRAWPKLDVVDHARRQLDPSGEEENFPPIEIIVLLGEPVHWESSLQILIDLLLTNGHPYKTDDSSGGFRNEIPYPHIPILACNADLQFMTDAPRPRFGHGAFLACLEALYLKITGFPLRYEALIGKPAETTYAHAEDVLIQQAREMPDVHITRLYFVGDNPDTDIFGANLYDRFLRRRSQSGARPEKLSKERGDRSADTHSHKQQPDKEDPKMMLETEMRAKILEKMFPGITESPVLECRAILVETGVGACAAKNAPSVPPVIKYPTPQSPLAGALPPPPAGFIATSSPLAIDHTKNNSNGHQNNGKSSAAKMHFPLSPRSSATSSGVTEVSSSGDESEFNTNNGLNNNSAAAGAGGIPKTPPSHQHRDFFVHRWEELNKPYQSAKNILEAIRLVYKQESFE